ncbi:hypothetical protein BC939DRAFT_450932 [Gamsiella multidivaricata]|uniref:uncharacterized protein n=1 Tax=Gamsiella multidivaricata TaxID=101098 RepID=UPI00221E5E69|nr:uncharacterized protein BC939DRAFT_450932 [Gamsiella multidivaricata]KAG0365936.1 hypothetical protein BGZ54_006038 [Gamsiella multidivaricata]KAI7823831.1 hypothetical protein BC939DRAFT_450932 [Gamsiella multidivaricata]
MNEMAKKVQNKIDTFARPRPDAKSMEDHGDDYITQEHHTARTRPHSFLSTSFTMEENDFSEAPVTPLSDTRSTRLSCSSTSGSRHSQQTSSSDHQHSKYRSKNSRESAEYDGYCSRPNSFVSTYQPNLSHKSSWQSLHLGDHSRRPVKATLNSPSEKESNAAFDRICSLLTHLIVDASTAVGTESSGAGATATSSVPAIVTPLMYAESESSEETRSEGDGDVADEMNHLDPIDDRDTRRWDSRVSRTRSYSDKGVSKRRSLFLELQSCQPDFGDPNDLNQHLCEQEDEPILCTEYVQEETFITEQESLETPAWTTAESLATLVPDAEDTLEYSETYGRSLRPLINRGLRRCASFPSMRADMIEMEHAEQLQEVIQLMDTELDRTVETIDGLTRDLMAVATHQNWMQMKLERSMRLQGLESEHDENTHPSRQSMDTARPSMSSDAATRYEEDEISGELEDWDDTTFWESSDIASSSLTTLRGNPYGSFEDPSMLKRDSDDVGFESRFGLPLESRPSARDLSTYFETLEKLTAMSLELEARNLEYAHGEEGDEGEEDDMTQLDKSISQRSSGSSYTLNNNYRISSSSNRSLDTCVEYFSGLKDEERDMPNGELDVDILPVTKSGSIGYDGQRSSITATSTMMFDGRRQRRFTMPATWPTPRLMESGQDPHLEEEDIQMSSEGHVAVTNIFNVYVCLVLMLFWSVAFVLATVFVIPSLAGMSRQRAVKAMEDVERVFAVPGCDVGATLEQQQQQDVASYDGLERLRSEYGSKSYRDYCRSGLFDQTIRLRPRNRGRLNLSRRQRDRIVGLRKEDCGATPMSLGTDWYGGNEIPSRDACLSPAGSTTSSTFSMANSSATLVDLACYGASL